VGLGGERGAEDVDELLVHVARGRGAVFVEEGGDPREVVVGVVVAERGRYGRPTILDVTHVGEDDGEVGGQGGAALGEVTQ